MNIEISVGEFLDKLTILEIKAERINDPEKLKSINKELGLLQNSWTQSPYYSQNLEQDIADLKNVNYSLWRIEDEIREKEKFKLFDQGFIELARAVYVTNDKRAAIKREINIKVGSNLIEEKSYSKY